MNKDNIKKAGIILAFAVFAFFVLSKIDVSLFGRASGALVIPTNTPHTANYGKLQIDVFKIKERLTGTEPFNVASASNENGVDISPDDNYIRTNDTINYTLEVRLSGRSNYEDASGGVIKIIGRLPNQGNPLVMVFEEQAWMKNIRYNEDKTEMYCEYHYEENQTPIGNQTLTFTVKTLGYKKSITDNMKPTFEAWTEGTERDINPNTFASHIIKDNGGLIISGHQNLDSVITGPSYTFNHNYEGQDGYMHAIIYGFAIQQDVPEFPDLRGIEFPWGPISFSYEVQYKYNDLNTENGYQILPNLNGTKLIDTGYNCGTANFYPTNSGNLHSCGFTRGTSGNDRIGVQGSGDINLNFSGTTINATVSNYVLNNKFPFRNGWDTADITKRTGYFSVWATQFFAPFYRPNTSHSYDYTMTYTLKSLTYKALNGTTYSKTYNSETGVPDAITTNNSIAYGFTSRTGGSFSDVMYPLIWEDPSRHGRLSMYDEQIVYAESYQTMTRDYPGGTDHFSAWDPTLLELSPQVGEYYYVRSNSNIYGFDAMDNSLTTRKFGVYKANRNSGPRTEAQLNSAYLDEFDWYDSYETATQTGKVSAIYIRFRGNTSKGNAVVTRFYFKAHVPISMIGQTTYVTNKGRPFSDTSYSGYTVRNGIIYANDPSTEASYHSENFFTPTRYNAQGDITQLETNTDLGETFVMIGYLTSITSSVSDLDTNNNPKSVYDVQEGVINFKVTPNITNNKEPTSNDQVIDRVTIKSYLPKGLTYRNGSSNKVPDSVVTDPDTGITTITWTLNNYQVNHDAPNFKDLTFKAQMSLDLKNNQQLEVKSTIEAKGDVRDETLFRTGKYGVTIDNLAGSKGIKFLTPEVIDIGGNFEVETKIGNTSSSDLINIQTVEILPRMPDGNIYTNAVYTKETTKSNFQGGYTATVVSLAPGEKMYYTTSKIENSGITTDPTGIFVTTGVNYATDSRWIEVGVGGTIPANAVAIGSTIPLIASKQSATHIIRINTFNNRQKDFYKFTASFTSDNLDTSVRTNTVKAIVRDYVLKGTVFKDRNNNAIYDTPSDWKLSGVTVQLYNESGQFIKSTTTDSNGNFIFEYLTRQKYYVKWTVDGQDHIYEVVQKNKGREDVSSVASSITSTVPNSYQYQSPTYEFVGLDPEVVIDNINLGIREVFKVTTRSETIGGGNGGTITGDETVVEGMNSTPNKIKIHANPGYYIETIKINGTAQNIPHTSDVTMPNFIEMHENKEVYVRFKPNKITLTKTEENGSLLPGAIIGLFQNGVEKHRCTSDLNGLCIIECIVPGTYTLKEIKQPNRFQIQETTQTVVVSSDNQISIDGRTKAPETTTGMVNIPTKIWLYNRDGKTAEHLYNDSLKFFITGPDNYMRTVDINDKGEFQVDHLPFGEYQITQTGSIDGYIMPSETMTFTIDENGHVSANGRGQDVFTYMSYPKPKISINKKDKTTGELLEGAEFKLTNITANTFVTITTNAGEYELDKGTYELTEVESPNRYIKMLNPVSIRVTANGDLYVDDVKKDTANIVNVDVQNELNKLTVKKLDENGNVLTGAKLGLYKGSTLIEEWTTTTEDKVFTGLEKGSYKVKEIEAPKDYIKITTEFDVEITSTGASPSTVIVSNELMPLVTVDKLDKETNERLAGAVMVIKDSSDNEVLTFTTTDELFSVRLPYGTYTLSELEAPDAHKKSEEVKTFTLSQTHKKEEITYYNEPYFSIIIKKLGTDGQLLEGAKFKLFDSDEKLVREITTTDAPFMIDKLDKGTYILKEVEAPSGYMINDEEYEITIHDISDNMQEIEVLNEKIPVQNTSKNKKNNQFIIIAVIIALIASGVILLGQIKRRRTSVISEEVK